MLKHCSLCQRDLPIESFNKKRKECKDCSKDLKLFGRYGITREQYNAKLEEQSGRCAICPATPEESGVFHNDHDHKCCPTIKTCGKCLRGLICSKCNTAIGLMNDNPERLRKAAEYVEKYKLERIDLH